MKKVFLKELKEIKIILLEQEGFWIKGLQEGIGKIKCDGKEMLVSYKEGVV